VRDYNVDGFRFDLMGVFHHSNADAWGSYLTSTYPSRNLLLYGEPWMGGGTPATESDYVRYGTVASMQAGHIGVFNGAYRDAIKGGTKDTVMNYMAGSGDTAAIALGLRGSPLATKGTGVLANVWNPAFAYDPEQSINYVSAHDDLNLYDKITYSGATGGAAGRAGQIDKFAAGLILTSQGIPFISEGDEFLHTKVVDGDYEKAKNSYNAPDAVNSVKWGDKATNASIFTYYRDAIALRKSNPALRLTTWDAVTSQISTTAAGQVVVARISSQASTPTSYDTVVVANPTSSAYTLTLPSGTWTKVLDGSGAVSATGNSAAARAITVFRRS
jgi:pullulanase